MPTTLELRQRLMAVQELSMRLLSGVTEEQFKRRPPATAEDPNPWCIAEVLAHVLFIEQLWDGRIALALVEDGATITPSTEEAHEEGARRGRQVPVPTLIHGLLGARRTDRAAPGAVGKRGREPASEHALAPAPAGTVGPRLDVHEDNRTPRGALPPDRGAARVRRCRARLRGRTMSTVDEIKARLDIVEVVGSYVKLQKAGRQFKAPCPFHNEKTPSFVVSPDRGTWHCFGACATGGDLFEFVQKKENVDFNGALRILADRAGVELQRRESSRRDELKPLYDANEAAAIYYHSLIINDAVPGSAREANAGAAYAEKRGIDHQALSDFQIGFAPAGWDGLREHLTKRSFTEEQLVEAGLLVQSERSGRAYDRFRERLMFPIRDDRGRVIGFGGRVLPGTESENQPGAKYINTPQTPIFDKGGVLYALDRAREAIRTTAAVVIVEGYMDVVAAHQFGFRNVVASMGTALTERQVAAIERLKPDRAVFAMDADAAGNAAALRDVQLVISTASRRSTPVATARGVGIESRLLIDWLVAALPAGVDPDDLVRRDPAEWEALIGSSKPVVDHLIDVVSAALDLSQPRDRAALVAEVMPAVRENRRPGGARALSAARRPPGPRRRRDAAAGAEVRPRATSEALRR